MFRNSLSFILLMIILYQPIFGQTSKSSYESLIDLFKEWREFEHPPLIDEKIPDYTAETFEKRWSDFKELKEKLHKIDTSGWKVEHQVDWMIVWAEMNGYDFNYHILKPWERDPAYYKTIWDYQSDVPAHEGPTHHAVVELWQYNFPLSKENQTKLAEEISIIPELNTQAKINLIGNAKELWIAGIRDIEHQVISLENLLKKNSIHESKELSKAINDAIVSTKEFILWLKENSTNKSGPSGIGKKNYTWYLQNVHLVPLTWDDEVMLLKAELARAWSSLKLLEHSHRDISLLEDVKSSEEYEKLAKNASEDLINFLKNEEIVTVKDYFKPALDKHLGTFIPSEKRNFFWIGAHYNPKPLFSHFYHWFELARMEVEPNKSIIRKKALLYNIFDSRNEGLATAVEEMFMNAGLYKNSPRVKEIVYIMIAQRAARGLGSLYAHSNQMTMEEAGKVHTEWTPRGWMKTEKELLIFEQHLYLRQPGYGTSYITGKYLIQNAMADFAKIKEEQNVEFKIKTFLDKLNMMGNIPASLAHWEMTNNNQNLKRILDKK